MMGRIRVSACDSSMCSSLCWVAQWHCCELALDLAEARLVWLRRWGSGVFIAWWEGLWGKHYEG